jgi:hypothetical protein
MVLNSVMLSDPLEVALSFGGKPILLAFLKISRQFAGRTLTLLLELNRMSSTTNLTAPVLNSAHLLVFASLQNLQFSLASGISVDLRVCLTTNSGYRMFGS